tara:strand:- start:2 stop:559 length:558 start_codon:yes stop_codon:yes gene_type:complete
MMASKNYIIYKIVCDDLPEFIYVGSTSDWIKRKRQHSQHYKNEDSKEYNYKVYRTIRENGGWENWRMIQISDVIPNVTKREAEAIEEEYYIELKANLNSQHAFLYPEVAREERKERGKKYSQSDKGRASTVRTNKNYRETENGKAVIKANASRRYVCDCGKEILMKGKKDHDKSQFHLNYIKEQN